jgi:hypothetical protein
MVFITFRAVSNKADVDVLIECSSILIIKADPFFVFLNQKQHL